MASNFVNVNQRIMKRQGTIAEKKRYAELMKKRRQRSENKKLRKIQEQKQSDELRTMNFRLKADNLALWGFDINHQADNRVKIWIDPHANLEKQTLKLNDQMSVDEAIKKAKELDDQTYQNDLSGMKATHRMGNASALGRDERIAKLQALVDQGMITKLSQAVQQFNGSITAGTIVGYLKAIHRCLKDDIEGDRDYGELVGAPLKQVKASLKTLADHDNVVYYDKDPLQGGQEITYDEYTKLYFERFGRFPKGVDPHLLERIESA